ncbi:hypothetical protein FQN53_006043 [Emmonsiellopsis sp. PD_33]|nr:hypothetical protein FQN53_006043 [Emmonsiellopsis sp. PD_33]
MSDQTIQGARETFATILSYYENRSSSGSPASLPPPDWARGARSAEYGNIIIGYSQPNPPSAEQAAQAQQHLSGILQSQEARDRFSPIERQLFMAAANEPIDLVNRRPPDSHPSNTHQSNAFPSSPQPPNPPPSSSTSLRKSHPPSMTPPPASPRASTEVLPQISPRTRAQLSSSGEAAVVNHEQSRRRARRVEAYNQLNTPRDG